MQLAHAEKGSSPDSEDGEYGELGTAIFDDDEISDKLSEDCYSTINIIAQEDGGDESPPFSISRNQGSL